MTAAAAMRALFLLAAVAAGSPVAAAAGSALPLDAAEVFEASEAAVGREVQDHALVAADGRHIRLSQFRGKPLVISPVYTSCFQVCPTTTSYLKSVIGIAASVLGEGAFGVLSIGFDAANDTPGRMRDYARERGIDSRQWTFASGDAETVAGLMADIGFRYQRTPAGFDHMIQATILDPEGRVYRHVYGQQFAAPLLVDALKRLIAGQRAVEPSMASWIESVRLVCTVFDPKSGRYRFDWSIVLGFAIGALCLAGIAAFIWRSWRDLPGRAT